MTALAIALAALSTILSFGMLALSRVFAVHALGGDDADRHLSRVSIRSGSFRRRPIATEGARAMNAGKAIAAFLIATACLSLCGCVTPAGRTPSALGDDKALIAPNVVFVIPPPAELGQTATVAQTIVAHFRDQPYASRRRSRSRRTSWNSPALDGLGAARPDHRLETGRIEHKQAPWLPQFVRPADILADVAIVYWPEKIVASSLARSGATLSADSRSRRISMGGRDIMVVEYGEGQGWNRSAKLRNLAFGYEIDIQSSESGAP